MSFCVTEKGKKVKGKKKKKKEKGQTPVCWSLTFDPHHTIIASMAFLHNGPYS
jgi:hypothetical protein